MRGHFFINPFSLFTIFFILPLAANQLRLSDIQPDSWHIESYYLIIQAIIIFGVMPALIMLLVKSKRNFHFGFNELPKKIEYTCSALLIVVVVLNLVLNQKMANMLVPVFNIENIEGRIHTTENVGFLATLTIGLWYAIGVTIYWVWRIRQSKYLLVLLIILIAMPLTRLARFDVASLIFAIGIMHLTTLGDKKINPIPAVIGSVVAIIFGSFLVKYRWSGGDVDAVSFSSYLGYHGYEGPFEVLTFIYTYYALSFENIDRFVNQFVGSGDYTYGLTMLAPITVGILKVNILFPELDVRDVFNLMRDPIHNLATVPTFLPAFAVDFGINFSFFPMLIFSLLGLFLYYKSRYSILMLSIWSMYSVCYFHMAFLNYFVSPSLGSVILLTIVAMHVLRKFAINK